MKLINSFFSLSTIVIVGFISVFWIGSYEQKMKLVDELPLSFIYRFLELSAIGAIGIGMLLLFNYLIDKLILKDVNVSKLIKLGIRSFVPVVLIALLGTILFFL
ncbi:hypothetical protein [Flavobacterium hydrophilum]|uniref:Uncharacterized protein n=1 Tax=Flavobacterium hydrophilum TaxID=2211445 RepID=A0A2V4C1D3_9FLAO|nr:hypothetical protein [Flavobacterium hydrophilum]PXY44817.1 hypothetical protein DMB68_15315 [Flavobacterium hydrophilum]